MRQPDAIVGAEQGKIRGRLFRKYVALFVAVALQGRLLRAMVALMHPATADRRAPKPGLGQGTRLAAQAYQRARAVE